jgi:hypothetical protein
MRGPLGRRNGEFCGFRYSDLQTVRPLDVARSWGSVHRPYVRQLWMDRPGTSISHLDRWRATSLSPHLMVASKGWLGRITQASWTDRTPVDCVVCCHPADPDTNESCTKPSAVATNGWACNLSGDSDFVHDPGY